MADTTQSAAGSGGPSPIVPDPGTLAAPLASPGFGPREAIDARRQAQFGDMADTPIDVNFNAAATRAQFETLNAMGKSFAANEDFRQKVQDQFLARLGLK